MNWIELVRSHWPNISDEDADYLLWNATAFPMAKVETIEKQIVKAYKKSGGDIGVACDQVEAEMWQSHLAWKLSHQNEVEFKEHE